MAVHEDELEPSNGFIGIYPYEGPPESVTACSNSTLALECPSTYQNTGVPFDVSMPLKIDLPTLILSNLTNGEVSSSVLA